MKGAEISLKISPKLDYTLIIDGEVFKINKETIAASHAEVEVAELLASN